MLAVYFGTDTSAVRRAAFATLSDTEAEPTLIDADSFQVGLIADAVGANSLFGGAQIYLLDMPSAHADFATEVTAHLEALAESNNQFVVIEGALVAAEKKPYQKYASTIEEFKKEADARFNAFAMADALAQKDKKNLWLLLQEAKAAGLAEEEIIGTLWWQLKTLRLAAQTKSASEAGLKDFPYNKAKRALSKFKDGELETLSHSLLTLYHEGHAGVADIDLTLEAWTLRV